MNTTPSTLRIYQRLNRLPAGAWLFSKALCWKAPYFSTIKPRVRLLEPGLSQWSLKKRRAVQNHIGSVHALAMGNLCEICAGTAMEASLPAGKRWIPKGMQIDYLKRAMTDLVGEARLAPEALQHDGDVPVQVEVKDRQGDPVVRATITMYVSSRKSQ